MASVGVNVSKVAEVKEGAGLVVRPRANGHANRARDRGGDHPQPMASEAFGRSEGPAVDSAITRAAALGVSLEAAQHLDGGAMDAALRLSEEQLNAVALFTRISVVASV